MGDLMKSATLKAAMANRAAGSGETERAKQLWRESANEFLVVVLETEPDDPRGRRARQEAVINTCKHAGSVVASNLLSQLIQQSNIHPQNVNNLRAFLDTNGIE